jgi:hypothetical protein
MATTVLEPASLPGVTRLMHDGAGDGMVVSCYAGGGIDGPRAPWRQEFVQALRAADARLMPAAAQRDEFTKSVNAILAVLGSRAIQRGRGLAVFASVARNYVRSFLLESTPATRLVAGPAPDVLPLLECLHRQRPYLVVHADLAHARLYAGHRHTVRFLSEVIQFVLRPRTAPGKGRGRLPVSDARARAAREQRFFRSVARETAAKWASDRYGGLILLGSADAIAHVRPALPAALAEAVVHTGPFPFVGGARRLQRAVGQIIDTATIDGTSHAIDRLTNAPPRVFGAAEVLEAIHAGRIAPRDCIVMATDPDEQTRPLFERLALAAAERHIATCFTSLTADLAARGGVVVIEVESLRRDTVRAPAHGRPGDVNLSGRLA